MAIKLLDEDDTITVKDSELSVENGDDGTTYTVRVVTPQYIKTLRKQHTKKRPTGGQGMADAFNAEAFSEAMWDHVLLSWTGVQHRGKEIAADELVQTSAGPVKAKTQLDGSRKVALMDLAGANQTVGEGHAESFRPPA